MAWHKLGRVYCADGFADWAQHSFMTPVPVQMSADVIRLYGGMRDDAGISRIGWVDLDAHNPLRVIAVCDAPALDLGEPGMFDDNGVILGDVIRTSEAELRMYYVGFQLVEKAKFLAFTGVAISDASGTRFDRVFPTPVLDRAPEALFINALHSIAQTETGFRAWISCGQRWQDINGRIYPQYNCWTVPSEDGLHFDMRDAVKIMDVNEAEYRIGRPRANRLADGSFELRVTSDTFDKHYSSHLAHSKDGIVFQRSDEVELPRGAPGDWDAEMTCYPARIDTPDGRSYLFYNGNNMGETGVGVAEWQAEA
ncbi:MAG: glycosylase [Epibacterium sp.]